MGDLKSKSCVVKTLKWFFLGGACFVLAACSGNQLSAYKNTTPELSLKRFFVGELTAAGVVENFSGQVIRKFNVTMQANWQADELTLKEWFTYDDGEKQLRTWVIQDLGNGRYSGTAGDILGEATGQAMGSALQWQYDMNLVVDGSEYQVSFDDWMFLVNENTIINRSDINKFGIKVASVLLVIQKQPSHSSTVSIE
ncbi:DUF3833 domain-containing protein [Shewanella gelidii]|uniref:DUF3833 domain-containing protein n=1 Tax=Shewanella gelidii TaxID=1642821 RepID=A0A917JIF9_9GAMM|nr:DUF3833 domain-containing protein [Shewanella gelidii]MCL1096733.1 DUF3833 domain-containing protein [Shewanella gelidii]GGI69808.1 hypothetical protein GCM10009332_03670 [Shewanella gelidii]